MPTSDTSLPGRLDDLLRPERLAAFDSGFFEREGYWVWDGILTAAGRARWSTSLQKLQAMKASLEKTNVPALTE